MTTKVKTIAAITPEQMTQFARKRLLKDYLEIMRNPLPTVRAAPLESNIFEWHCNIDSPDPKYILHVILLFPIAYPSTPPRVKLCTPIEHPHVFGEWICLDMLGTHGVQDKFQGWTSAYSVQSILLQLQSFFFEEMSFGVKHKQAIAQFRCPCGHSATSPWPAASGTVTTTSNEEELKEERDPEIILQNNEKKIMEMFTMPVFQHILRFIPLKIIVRNLENSAKVFRKLCNQDIVQLRKELVCFHTKMTFEEALLGVGISFQYNPRGQIQYVSTPMDLLSFFAFEKYKMTMSMWNEPITHFIPLYISKAHGHASIPFLKYCIQKIYGDKIFKPLRALDLICKLMNSMIVLVMSGNSHASMKALDGYVAFHRILIALAMEFPQIKGHVDDKIREFMLIDASRTKARTPSLGDFLPMLTISENYSWKDLGMLVLQETLTRNVLWGFKKYPGLKVETPNGVRMMFDATQVSLRLIMFHVYFLKNFAPRKGQKIEELAQAYDEGYGRPSEEVRKAFQDQVFHLQKVASFEAFFIKCYFKLDSKNAEESVSRLLRNAVTRSAALKYT